MPTMQIFFIISLLLMATLMPVQAVYYQVIYNATGTPGGTRFVESGSPGVLTPYSMHQDTYGESFNKNIQMIELRLRKLQ